MLHKAVCCLLLLLVALASAQASPIEIRIASEGTLADPMESNDSPDPYGIGNGETIVITKHSAWYGPLPDSEWVSYANTGTDVPPYEPTNDVIVTFTQLFTLPAGYHFTGWLSVMADDSTTVSLNGTVIVAEAEQTGNNYWRCSDTPTGCREPTMLTIDFGNAQDPLPWQGSNRVLVGSNLFQAGQNQLDFAVAQRHRVAFGLDYTGVLTPTPEPAAGALILVGLLPLLWLAGRRRKAAMALASQSAGRCSPTR